MKVLVFAILLPLLPLAAFAESGCGPLEQISREIENTWLSDSFSTTEQIQKFWEIHQRFGFVRQGETILLVAKSESMAQEVINDLKSFREQGTAKKVEFPEIKNGHAYDVTQLLPEMMRHLHARDNTYTGPNCWNFCLRGLVTEGSLAMSPQEFHHWMTSPLAREIKEYRDLKTGDVLVFRKNIEPGRPVAKREVHGAIYISPRLALSKYAAGRYHPNRILDLHEAISLYYPGKSDSVRVFRMTPILEAAQQLKSLRSVKLRALLKEAFELERQLDALAIGTHADGARMTMKERFVIEQRLESFAKDLQLVSRPEIKRLEQQNTLSHQDSIELALWRGLNFKANNYGKTPQLLE